MNRSYSKIRHIQESNIALEQRRFNQLIESKMGSVKPLISEDEVAMDSLKDVLLQKVGAGTGNKYKEICSVCSKQDLSVDNERAKKAAQEFDKGIQGGENPFSNFGGAGYPNKDSSAYKAGDALRSNLTSAEDICTMIQYYSLYTGSGEDFCEAVEGELNYKVDSTSNLDLLVGKPIYDILHR